MYRKFNDTLFFQANIKIEAGTPIEILKAELDDRYKSGVRVVVRILKNNEEIDICASWLEMLSDNELRDLKLKIINNEYKQ